MASIRCHTVPQFYLESFLAAGEKCFWVYDKKDGSTRPQQPINTGVIGDYYLSHPDENGKKDKRMEEFLSQWEGKAKPIIEKWGNPPYQIDKEEIPIMALFLSFLHTRVPSSVNNVKDIHIAGVDHLLDGLKESLRTPEGQKREYERYLKNAEDETPLSLEEFVKMAAEYWEAVDIEVDEKYMVGWSLSVSEAICRSMKDMRWSIRSLKEGKFFVTSDTPLSAISINKGGQLIIGGGLRSPCMELAFPISPKACLLLSKGPVLSNFIKHSFVDEINRRTICMANQYVISPFQSNRIKKMVNDYSYTFQRSRIDPKLIKDRLQKQGIEWLKD